MPIREHFISAIGRLANDQTVATDLWLEVEESYNGRGRHYHNLQHLDAVLEQLIPFSDRHFGNWDTVVFAIVWHDIVYKVHKQNNEEKSAAHAVKRLTDLGASHVQIEHCKNLILATKRHERQDFETNLFTDADLSILGSDSSTYKSYAALIRKEYSIYPDFMYNPGRRKVLQHFLGMKKIFKTEEFASRYEEAARRNIADELTSLS